MVASAAKFWRIPGNNPHASPSGGQARLVVRSSAPHLLRWAAKPHRHGREHARLIYFLIVLVQRKRKPLLVRNPETFVYQRALLFKILFQRLTHFLVGRHVR